MQDIHIRPLGTLEELKQVEAVQRAAWGDPHTIIYQHMLISLVRNGGSVLGALKDGQVIGAVIGYLGLEDLDSERPAMANLKLVSQRMAVLPEFRNSGVGYDLKLAQRRFAIEYGLRLITWTFDPLNSRNAHFNLRKLGALCQVYHRDYYGTSDSALVKAHSSDRLLCEWWVTSNRVQQRLNGGRSSLSLQMYLDGNANILNPSGISAANLPTPSEYLAQPNSTLALVEIPEDYDAIVRADEGLAVAWRAQSRELLEGLIMQGWAATDFIHAEHEGRMRSFYGMSFAEYSDIRMTRFSAN